MYYSTIDIYLCQVDIYKYLYIFLGGVYMGEYKNKTYPLRLDNNLMDKLRKLAEQEDRPLSKQIERIVREYIQAYEQEHGEINLDD